MLTSHPATTFTSPRSTFRPADLRHTSLTCYGAGLLPFFFAKQPFSLTTSNIKCDSCLEHFSCKLFFLFVTALFSLSLPCFAQQNAARTAVKADIPPDTEIWQKAVSEDSEGEWKYLKGAAEVHTSEMTITADEIDFNEDTAWAYARGHVRLVHFATGDILNADHAEYNLKTEEGKFWIVNGTSPTRFITSPGLLTTTNPFYYQGQWADRIKGRLILHKGFVTDCKIPKPWWVFEGPVFDIVPGQRAIARRSIFRFRHVPILYLPYFRRTLGKNTRQSGFLAPGIGHSTTRGYILGEGYYWAINRSYDMDYIFQDFTSRGPSHTIDFRGKPNDVSAINFDFFSVEDKGVPSNLPGAGQKQGGEEIQISGKTQIFGFKGFVDYDYLSSFIFSVAFTNSFTPQHNSIGFLQRHFDNDVYTLNFVVSRSQVYESFTDAKDQVILQKLPSIETSSRLQQLLESKIPLWFSYNASSGLLNRQDPVMQTGYLNQRTDIKPTVSSAFSFAGFSLYPSVSFEATDYSKQYSSNNSTAVSVNAGNLFRHDADFNVDFRLPSLERTYTPPAWMHLGTKIKHVIEAEAQYEYVTGVNPAVFQKIIPFDATDIVSDTNQITYGLTNRLYKKDKKGDVREVFTWRLRQARYFDPSFGGTVVAGQRNVVLPVELLTPYTFLDGPRSYSPIVSSLSFNLYSFFGISYDTSYDPRHHRFDNQTFWGTIQHSKYFFNLGDTAITTNQLLLQPDGLPLFPTTNQAFIKAGWGSTNRKGFNASAQVSYDLTNHEVTLSTYELSYNTNCCGFSMELRRINNVVRDDNQYLFSFSVANVGSIGTLPRQSRIF